MRICIRTCEMREHARSNVRYMPPRRKGDRPGSPRKHNDRHKTGMWPQAQRQTERCKHPATQYGRSPRKHNDRHQTEMWPQAQRQTERWEHPATQQGKEKRGSRGGPPRPAQAIGVSVYFAGAMNQTHLTEIWG